MMMADGACVIWLADDVVMVVVVVDDDEVALYGKGKEIREKFI